MIHGEADAGHFSFAVELWKVFTDQMSSPYLTHSLLTEIWLLCRVLEELVSCLVTKEVSEVNFSVSCQGSVLRYTLNSFCMTNMPCQ